MVSQPETPPRNPDAKRKFEADVSNKSNEQIYAEFAESVVQSEVIKNENDKSENVDKVKISGDVLNSIKDKNNNRQKLVDIAEKVRQTLVAIKIDDGTGNHIQRLPTGESGKVLKVLAGSIDINDVNEKNAVYLNHILSLGMQNQLNSAQELVAAFTSVKNLEFIDIHLHDKVAETFQTSIRSLPLSEEDRERYLDQLKTASQRQSEKSESAKTKEEISRMRNESNSTAQRVNAIIEEITNESHANRLNGSSRLKTKTPGEEQEQEKRDILRTIRGDLLVNFNQVLVGVNTDADLGSSINNFKRKANDYFNEGIITEEELISLYEEVEKFRVVSHKQLREIFKHQGRGLLDLAEVYSGTTWNPEELRLINGLDNVDNLAAYVKEKYNGFETNENWNVFYKDVKGIFEKLFEIPQAQPKLLWEQGFNQLHEGFFYKELTGRLRGLGEAMKRDDYFKNKKVKVLDFYDEQSQFNVTESPYGPNTRLSGKSLVTLDVGIAVQRTLHDQMVMLHEIMEYTHNANIINLMGMGFDKIAEYAARVSLRDIDLLFHTTEGLTEAYNFYLQNMYQELSLNYHMIPTNFGKVSVATGLDPIESRAYRQLAALKGITKLNDPSLIRLLKMASGLAKGVYGEFWGAAMTARMPLDYSIQYKKNAKGEYEKDKDGRWIIDKFDLEANYQSVHFPGLEKMLKDIDLDYQLQRFNHPRYWAKARYAYAPRKYNHHLDEETKQDYFNSKHSIIYKYGDMANDAFIQGRTPELAKFDDRYVMWNEKMRTSSIDYFLRSAWRMTQYKKYFVYQKDENGELIKHKESGKLLIDFDKTMKKLQGIGPFMVKTFIDDFFDPGGRSQEGQLGEAELAGLGLADLAPEIIKKYAPNYYKLNKEGKKKAEKKIRSGLYVDYIFERLIDERPTHFIAMENMRYTPKGERLLSMRLEEKLHEIFGNRYKANYIKSVLLPMYIGGIELVENDMWQQKKKEWKTFLEKDEFPSDPLAYTLKESDFDSVSIKEKLMNYYQLAQTQAGEQEDHVSINDENFLESVKTLFRTLKESIEDKGTGINGKDRTDEFGKGVEAGEPYKNALVKRYAQMMEKGQGYIGHYLKGNLFDFSEFLFQQAGSRGPERMWGEVAVVATKMSPALKTMIYEVIPELVKKEYPNNHAFEEEIKRSLVKPFKEWYDAIAVIDPDLGLIEAKYLVTYLTQIMGKDRNMRYKVISDVVASFARRTWSTQGSLMADHFWGNIRRPTTTLDSDGVETLVHTLLDSVHMPHSEKKIIGYKKNFLGIEQPITKDIYEDRNMELVEEVLGVTQWNRFVEAIPIGGPIIMLILFLLAQMALDKEKKKG